MDVTTSFSSLDITIGGLDIATANKQTHPFSLDVYYLLGLTVMAFCTMLIVLRIRIYSRRLDNKKCSSSAKFSGENFFLVDLSKG